MKCSLCNHPRREHSAAGRCMRNPHARLFDRELLPSFFTPKGAAAILTKTPREIAAELDAMPNMSRREICGLAVEHVGDGFRATLPNGSLTSWWKSGTMATIIDSWSRPAKV